MQLLQAGQGESCSRQKNHTGGSQGIATELDAKTRDIAAWVFRFSVYGLKSRSVL